MYIFLECIIYNGPSWDQNNGLKKKKDLVRWNFGTLGKENILKAARRKKEKEQQVSYKGLEIIMVPTFSIAILGARRQWNNHFKIPKENNFQLQILHPKYQSNERVELRFLKTFSCHAHFLRKLFSCHTPFLRKILEEEIHQKEGIHKKDRNMVCWVWLHITDDQVKLP